MKSGQVLINENQFSFFDKYILTFKVLFFTNNSGINIYILIIIQITKKSELIKNISSETIGQNNLLNNYLCRYKLFFYIQSYNDIMVQ